MKKAKQFLALLLIAAMVLVNVPAPAYAITTNADGYIEVRTIEDLYSIRNDLTANYILMNDIDLTAATAEGGDWDMEGRGWNPIGSNNVYGDSAFSGVFDGNGYSVIGMRINVASVPSGTGVVRLGLFSNVTGTVKNLTVTGEINYSSNKSFYIGSIAGTCSGTIENCINYANVYGCAAACDVNGYVGGIVGMAFNNAYITQSANIGCVSSYCYSGEAKASNGDLNYAGGIAGIGNSDTQISICYNTGKISARATGYYSSGSWYSSDAFAAGIACDSKNVDCYNVGAVESKKYDSEGDLFAYGIGGIATRCYNMGTVTGGYEKYAISSVNSTNCYYLSGSGSSSTGAAALTNSQMLLSSVYVGFDFSEIWVQNKNAEYPYPQLRSNPQALWVIESVTLSAAPVKTSYAYDEALDLTGAEITVAIQGGETQVIPVTAAMVSGYDAETPGQQTLTVTYNGRTVGSFTVTVAERPYTPIYTVADLYNIRYDLTGDYRLMNDIDLTEVTAKGGDWDFMGNGWNPIGSNDIYADGAFSGEFDGNGHKIIGMRINAVSSPSGTVPEPSIGLFANITGYVHDLYLDEVNIVSGIGEYIGAVTGKNAGVIENCAVTGSVKMKRYGDNLGGGITGQNSGDISACWNAATVSLAADDYHSSSLYRIGGIAGENISGGSIEDCYNSGDVNSSYSSAPINGIAYNYYGTIKTSYNVGALTGPAGIIGWGIGYAYNGTNSNCYYLNGTGKSTTGATALTEVQMKLMAPFSGFDFSNTWVLDANAVYPYPQLRNNIQDMNETVKVLSIITLPAKQTYYTGEVLELKGCCIRVTYASGRVETLDVTEDMVSGFDSTAAGEQTVNVSYRGHSNTFTVTVQERPVIKSMQMVSQPTVTQFVVGTAFDFSGAKFKVTYQDGSSETLDILEATLSGHDIHHIGAQTVTVTYLDSTTTFVISVLPLAVESLRMDKEPDKLTYKEGENIDLTGIVLVAVMNDGTEYNVTENYTVAGYTGQPGSNTVILTYSGKSISFSVMVQAKLVDFLELKTVPAKTEYYEGQALDLTGLELIAHYDNGEALVVTDYTVSGYSNTPGIKTVQLSFGGKTAAFSVMVLARIITELSIVSMPAKLTYFQHEDFDPTGLVVSASYNDGTTEYVTDYTLVGYSSNPGTHTMSISYGGYVLQFEVTVQAKVLTHLRIQSPQKLNYNIGESFDATGLVVVACYNNGQQIPVEDYVLSGFNSNQPGTKTVTVSYGGLTGSFGVCILERNAIETNGSFVVDHLEARLGDEIRLPVTVSNNVGIAGMRHTFHFDASNLKLIGIELQGDFTMGTLIVNEEKVQQGELTVVWFCNDDIAVDGVVYELVFEVLETATDGITEVTLTFEENDNANISGDNLIFGSQDGSVEIRAYWLGDLNGDRKYAMVDLVMLAQYVSGMKIEMTENMLLSADVNEDGSVNIHDVILLNQWLLAENI